MAENIVNDFILPPGRYLIEENDVGSCIGTIVRFPIAVYGKCDSGLPLKMIVHNPEPEIPNQPWVPEVEVSYSVVIFARGFAQEIKIQDKDYFIVNSDHILAFIS